MWQRKLRTLMDHLAAWQLIQVRQVYKWENINLTLLITMSTFFVTRNSFRAWSFHESWVPFDVTSTCSTSPTAQVCNLFRTVFFNVRWLSFCCMHFRSQSLVKIFRQQLAWRTLEVHSLVVVTVVQYTRVDHSARRPGLIKRFILPELANWCQISMGWWQHWSLYIEWPPQISDRPDLQSMTSGDAWWIRMHGA